MLQIITQIGKYFLLMKAEIRKKKNSRLDFASLAKYSFSKKVQIYLIDFTLYWLMKVLGGTVRFDASGMNKAKHDGWKYVKRFTDAKPRSIAAFWHDRILLTTYYWRFSNFAAMVSESFDGEYIARVSQRFGHAMARGSSTRGGTKALRLMKHLLTEEEFTLTLTVDGPKGPRYEVKEGVVLLAKITKVPIIPVVVEPKNFWTLGSWDKMQIPKPFTKAKIFIGEPVSVPADADKKTLGEKRTELQRKLDELVASAEQWRKQK